MYRKMLNFSRQLEPKIGHEAETSIKNQIFWEGLFFDIEGTRKQFL
jgi:hypothetical protein